MKGFTSWIMSTMIVLSATGMALASLPEGLMIVGYDGSAWYPYISQPGSNKWKKLKAIQDPAYLTWQAGGTGRFLIKGNDGKVYQYELGSKEPKHLDFFDDANFTQLRAFDTGFVMVKLQEGKSSETSIVAFVDDQMPKTILRQSSAQFHPYVHNNYLYYAHVSCRLECKPLIQEVWRKELDTGRTQQLTLLNVTSYLYSVDADNHYGFISSNKNGYYHLARMDMTSGELSWLTDGQVTDSFPSVAQDGSLYFIRRTSLGSQLMSIPSDLIMAKTTEINNSMEVIKLPKDVKKIRYLEISN